ncbi:pentatricopeptide repeat-containing protein At4g02750-like [Selaginella moellendorffii]|uniref:pentatricopeptide repeat-containing protein At4g02750-like n=1 Tax=Selaginella moellendorffii TaxID=88036 RepID=UPI000D1CA157|nr:pentatricopeptide repeat-containing protein At4g02750-like [Selaginella moellendorffii]|eukprot:XP_024515210.1 pentatricopeptide repeat-containing protein At4g02750-like [Selaginella moellendorffii]
MVAFALNGHLDEARSLFAAIDSRDCVCWNAMIQALVLNGENSWAKEAFNRMPCRDSFAWTTIIAMYAQAEEPDRSKAMFDSMESPDVVSWNAMLAAYAQNGLIAQSDELLLRFPHWNLVTWSIMIQALAQAGQMDRAEKFFQTLPRKDPMCSTVMISGYGISGDIQRAKRIYDQTFEPNVVTSTAMLTALAANGYLEQAELLFESILDKNVVTWTAMVAAYALNGRPCEAFCAFELVPQKHVVSLAYCPCGICPSWAHAQSGHGSDTLGLFRIMDLEGVKSNDNTLVGVLSACNHIGLLRAGREYFLSMDSDRGIRPTFQHYCCVVDMLGRSGLVRDAEELLENMPFFAGSAAWNTLLSACSKAEATPKIVEEERFSLPLLGEDEDAATFVLLTGKWLDRCARFTRDTSQVQSAPSEEDHGGSSGVQIQVMVDLDPGVSMQEPDGSREHGNAETSYSTGEAAGGSAIGGGVEVGGRNEAPSAIGGGADLGGGNGGHATAPEGHRNEVVTMLEADTILNEQVHETII